MNVAPILAIAAGCGFGALLGGVFLGGPISGIGIGIAIGAGVGLGWTASTWSDE